MANELMSREEVQNALGQLALKGAMIEEQFGIVKNALQEHDKAILTIGEREKSHYEEFLQFKQVQMDRERIEASEVNNVTNCINNRVELLLRPHDRFDLFGSFAKKCRSDCKKHSYMLGKGAVDTKVMYYSELLKYIGNWEPVGWGTDGYIHHLDSLREQKSNA